MFTQDMVKTTRLRSSLETLLGKQFVNRAATKAEWEELLLSVISMTFYHRKGKCTRCWQPLEWNERRKLGYQDWCRPPPEGGLIKMLS